MLKDKRIFEVGDPESILTTKNIERVYGVRSDVTRDREGRPYVMPLDPI